MARIPLIGVPKHLWDTITGSYDASPGLLLWRVFLVAGFFVTITWLIIATGGGAVMGILIFFIVTSFLSAIFRDDVVAIWADLWHFRWGEVKI